MLLLRPNENDRAESPIPRVRLLSALCAALPLGSKHAIVVCCVLVGMLLDLGFHSINRRGS